MGRGSIFQCLWIQIWAVYSISIGTNFALLFCNHSCCFYHHHFVPVMPLFLFYACQRWWGMPCGLCLPLLPVVDSEVQIRYRTVQTVELTCHQGMWLTHHRTKAQRVAESKSIRLCCATGHGVGRWALGGRSGKQYFLCTCECGDRQLARICLGYCIGTTIIEVLTVAIG